MARAAVLLPLLLSLLAVRSAAATSLSYQFCILGTNGSTTGCAPLVPNLIGACSASTQAVDGACYCGNPVTGAGCLKFASLSASTVPRMDAVSDGVHLEFLDRQLRGSGADHVG